MTHPEELLADLVAGRLSSQDRAVVERHLASCGRCRRETALAGASRRALGSLEEAVPPARLRRAIEEAAATQTVTPTAAAMRRRYRILGVAAAAAVVALVAIALPHLGGPAVTSAANGRAGLPAAASQPSRVPTSLSLEIQHVDYGPSSIATLAKPKSAFSSEAGGPAPQTGGELGSRSEEVAALGCLDRAFPGFGGTPTRLIRATFQGRPAYLGVFLEGPGAGLPADTRSVRVASVDSCTVLSFSRAQL